MDGLDKSYDRANGGRMRSPECGHCPRHCYAQALLTACSAAPGFGYTRFGASQVYFHFRDPPMSAFIALVLCANALQMHSTPRALALAHRVFAVQKSCFLVLPFGSSHVRKITSNRSMSRATRAMLSTVRSQLLQRGAVAVPTRSARCTSGCGWSFGCSRVS